MATDADRKRLFVGWYADRPRPAAFACVDLDSAGAQRLGLANRRDYWLLERSALSHCEPPQP